MSSPAVLARLAGRPLAIAPRGIDVLLASLRQGFGRQAAGLSLDAQPPMLPVLRDAETLPRLGYALTGSGIAVVPVLGPLVSRSDWLSALFGAASYGEVGDAVEAAFADPASRAVLLEVDSPGGEIGGLFDLVERIAALGEETSKPLWAVATETALSAAFAIASAAARLYVTRTGEVGSVGVVAVHVDESAADAMAGLKWTLVHAGARKVDGNPHEPLSGSAFSDIQSDVDVLHEQLVALVARNRAMAPGAVGATEAAAYRGTRGLEAGFADRLGSLDRALADLEAELAAPHAAPARSDRAPTPQPARSMPMTTDTPAGEQPAGAAQVSAASPVPPADRTPGLSTRGEGPPPLPESPAPAPGESAPAVVGAPHTETPPADRLRAEYAEIAAVAAQAARLGVSVDAADAMRKGVAADALRRSVLDTLAARSEAAEVVAAPTPAATGDSPIVRRARERAAQAKPARP